MLPLYCFDYCSFEMLQALSLLFETAMSILGLLWFQMNFKIVFPIPVKYMIGILIRNTLNL
jgi:hypothetical protein